VSGSVDRTLDRIDGHLTGYAHVANSVREGVGYRSLAVLINSWEDVEPRVAYRTSSETLASGPSWTAIELIALEEDSGAADSDHAVVVERARAVWAIAPIGDLRPPVGYLLIDRDPANPFTCSELDAVKSAAIAMTAPVVEAEMWGAREQVALERKTIMDMSESVVEASESRGWQESAHQELQRAFDTLTEQKLEVEEAYSWSTVAHRELQKAFDDLEIANTAKTRFLATVSHELKTPLTSISAFTDILKKNRGSHLESKELKQLDVISRNVHRLNLLINDLLDLTRIDAGTLNLEPDDFQVSRLLGDMTAMFEPIMGRRNQRLVIDDGSMDRWMSGDRDRLEQMITNLVTNASKFSPAGAAINMGTVVEDGDLKMTVTDHGVGIPLAAQPQIFEAFYRVDSEETRSVPGTGVGLYITASIVKLHGGTINVESEPGRAPHSG
jgi:signal transduction histidine kinase